MDKKLEATANETSEIQDFEDDGRIGAKIGKRGDLHNFWISNQEKAVCFLYNLCAISIFSLFPVVFDVFDENLNLVKISKDKLSVNSQSAFASLKVIREALKKAPFLTRRLT